jgi:hypothetical protein
MVKDEQYCGGGNYRSKIKKNGDGIIQIGPF